LRERHHGVAGQPQAVHRLGVGGDKLGGEVGLSGVGGQQPGHLGDGGVVAVGKIVGCVGERRREGGVERVDELPVGVAGELEGEVGSVGRGLGVHRANVMSVILTFNVCIEDLAFGRTVPGVDTDLQRLKH
jgi:hypothetical protein